MKISQETILLAITYHEDSGPLLTKRAGVLLQDLKKSRSQKIQV